MTKLITKFMVARHFARNDSGATAIEYGMIAGLIAVVIIGTVSLLGPQLEAVFKSINAELPAATG